MHSMCTTSIQIEPERLNEYQIPAPPGQNGQILQWFVIVLKPYGTAHLCLNRTTINYTLIRPINRGTTINYILPELSNVPHKTIIDACSGYQNLKLD